jgi:signal peptidase complex subunit 2
VVDLVSLSDSPASRFLTAHDLQYLSRPDLYKQDYTHTDVRLVLGWLAVIVAAGTGYYGWKIEFEAAKPVVWVGVLLYVFFISSTRT